MIRVLGGALCVLTLVVVASALARMDLYADAYGFSVPRLAGFAAQVWLGLVFVLVVVAGVRLRARWMPRAVVASGVAVLLAVAALNPDAVMARTHIDRLSHGYAVDEDYLQSLSLDAVAELDRLPEPTRTCVLAPLARKLAKPVPWYQRTLSRQRARALLARRPPDPSRYACRAR